jgi:hypothetical protein
MHIVLMMLSSKEFAALVTLTFPRLVARGDDIFSLENDRFHL